jgi:predicted Zn finger-like uncharacterized protein
MIVQCENCDTRFHVADARIPAKGARVRCSRCHHRFHITPSSSAPPAQPAAPSQGSARPPARGGEAAADDELDNPEFLFDKPAESAPPRARKAAPQAETVVYDAPPAPEPPAAPAPPEPIQPKAPPVVHEERVVESGGKTAQEMLDAGAPQLESTRYEIGGSLGGDDDSDDTMGSSFVGERAPEPEPEAEIPRRGELDTLAADLGEDEDSSFADWDPLATPAIPQEAAPPGIFAAAATRAAAPVSLGSADSVFDQPDLAPASESKKRSVPDMPIFDPEAAGPAALILRIAAGIVGLLLVGAAGRLLWLQRDSVPPEAQVIQTAGWVAADLETFLARDATGERVLIVRGNLFPQGAAAPPQVSMRLLDSNGLSLAESEQTWLERIDDAEVAPERLAPRLASAGGDIGALGQQVTGFTAVLHDPPPGVRRVEITLHARAAPPAGTATANSPAPASPEPGAVAPIETATPSSTALPRVPAETGAVPAAPAPED